MKHNFREKIFRIPLFIVVALILLFTSFNYFLIPALVHSKETLLVPSVINMKKDDATRLLDSLGLKPLDGGIRKDQKIKPGRISLQTPFAGSAVRKGRRIYLVMSGGEEKVSVPSLKGKSLRDALFALERIGLLMGEPSYSVSDDYPAGTVFIQEIASGSTVSKGTQVSVVVSQGKSTDRVRVPDVTNKTLNEAIAFLKSKNFTIGKISFEHTIEFPPNTVLDQYPIPGDFVPFGATIDLFVSREKVKVTEH
ncbi:MAG: PASTA domain-containing protein [Ignavibacteria bacterium]|nr:PASTA domain-containing protein [Ignavibacteria bacterium]